MTRQKRESDGVKAQTAVSWIAHMGETRWPYRRNDLKDHPRGQPKAMPISHSADRTSCFARLVVRLACSAGLTLLLGWTSSSAFAGSRVERIQTEQTLVCGVSDEVPGFA